ncbi:MAG: helix-turn-helix domain-containing protein [Chthoniobacterales bacterium]
MSTKKREIIFDADALLERIEGFNAGTERARERKVKVPLPVKPIPAKEIYAIRQNLGFTQTQFALLLNVPRVTAISWENGVRKPSGAALRLLAITRKHPEALEAC